MKTDPDDASTHVDERRQAVDSEETALASRRRIVGEGGNEDAAAAIAEIERFRREHRPTLGGVTLRELIEEGRE